MIKNQLDRFDQQMCLARLLARLFLPMTNVSAQKKRGERENDKCELRRDSRGKSDELHDEEEKSLAIVNAHAYVQSSMETKEGKKREKQVY